jgi:hypothetical protein
MGCLVGARVGTAERRPYPVVAELAPRSKDQFKMQLRIVFYDTV